jgi:hypothetical protein
MSTLLAKQRSLSSLTGEREREGETLLESLIATQLVKKFCVFY